MSVAHFTHVQMGQNMFEKKIGLHHNLVAYYSDTASSLEFTSMNFIP